MEEKEEKDASNEAAESGGGAGRIKPAHNHEKPQNIWPLGTPRRFVSIA